MQMMKPQIYFIMQLTSWNEYRSFNTKIKHFQLELEKQPEQTKPKKIVTFITGRSIKKRLLQFD